MSLSSGNVSESFARLRLLNSPLHCLYPSVKFSYHTPSNLQNLNAAAPEPPTQGMVKLTPQNYRFIQRALSNIILYVQLENRRVSIATICQTILDETRSIEAVGMAYIENIKRQDALETQAKEVKEGEEGEEEDEDNNEENEDPEEKEEEDTK